MVQEEDQQKPLIWIFPSFVRYPLIFVVADDLTLHPFMQFRFGIVANLISAQRTKEPQKEIICVCLAFALFWTVKVKTMNTKFNEIVKQLLTSHVLINVFSLCFRNPKNGVEKEIWQACYAFASRFKTIGAGWLRTLLKPSPDDMW